MLRGLAWDHPRCLLPLRAAAELWNRRTGTSVEWHARSLSAFGDQPLAEAVEGFDLVVVDHPLVGEAARDASFQSLDNLVTPARMRQLEAAAVGPSYRSYHYADRQWALPVDASCQVQAARADLLGAREVPATWVEALDLARALRGRIALPLQSAQAMSSFCTLIANSGHPLAGEACDVDEGAGTDAIETLKELVDCAVPQLLGAEPPEALAALTSGDEVAYIPLTYAYVTYSTMGRVRNPCRFDDLPSAGLGPVGATLGGAGLAIPSGSASQEAATAFATWICGPDAQLDVVARSGGQPASKHAWDDVELDEETGHMYSLTRRSIEGAWVRPREAWWPPFQRQGGAIIQSGLLEHRASSDLLRDLRACLHRCFDSAETAGQL